MVYSLVVQIVWFGGYVFDYCFLVVFWVLVEGMYVVVVGLVIGFGLEVGEIDVFGLLVVGGEQCVDVVVWYVGIV